jgi:AhpD family alkylhydroperoxidase
MNQRLDFYSSGPAAIKAMVGLEQRINKSQLEQPLVELVRLRASQINGCAYCMDLHSSDARKAGEDARRLATLSAWRETPFFSERERAALAWTEALTLIHIDHVPDAVWAAVQPHFFAEEITDLTLLIVAINGWNRFSIAFRKAPE